MKSPIAGIFFGGLVLGFFAALLVVNVVHPVQPGAGCPKVTVTK